MARVEAGIHFPADGDDTPEEKMSPLNFLINIITGVFTPFLGVLCACGILKGILALLTATGILSDASGTYNILYSLGDAAFYFMPPILGFAAAKKFKLPEMEGLLIGLSMVYLCVHHLFHRRCRSLRLRRPLVFYGRYGCLRITHFLQR